MATCSAIGIEIDGKIIAVHCHWDGYLENNGEILFKHYQNPEKILKLVSFGNMSSLGSDVEPAAGVSHSFDKKAENVTVYYGRDRGEDGVESRTFNTRDEMIAWYSDAEYFYLWTNEHWIYSQGRSWADLGLALESIEVEEDE